MPEATARRRVPADTPGLGGRRSRPVSQWPAAVVAEQPAPVVLVGGGQEARTAGYVERAPLPELARAVRTVWIQAAGDSEYLQRHLPTGGVEIHVPLGGEPRLLGPLTGPRVDVIPAFTTVIGVRFWPGALPQPFPTRQLAPMSPALEELVDDQLSLAELWGTSVRRVAEAMATAPTPARALALLQAYVLRVVRDCSGPDPLVEEAVRALMPWHPVDVGALATHLGLSASQLRRRCQRAVGTGPKALQRTLRFQGFLALAQAGATASGRRGADGAASLAVDTGYADQAHLSRECQRLAGVSPSRLLGGDVERCLCGHEHAASYRPFLALRGGPPLTL